MQYTQTIAQDAPPLSRSSWRFVLYFYLKSRKTLSAIFIFEAAQAACTILLPYAVKKIIDAVNLARDTGADIFAAAENALILFALLNLGIVLFSRASGAALVMTGPNIIRIVISCRISPAHSRTALPKSQPAVCMRCGRSLSIFTR
jgi:ATP-binding cassette subfamily B protein